MRYFIMREGNYIDADVNYNSDTTRPKEHDTDHSPEFFPVCKGDVLKLSGEMDPFSISINFDQKVVIIDDDKLAKVASYARVKEWNAQNQNATVLYDEARYGRGFYMPIQVQVRGICQAERSVIEISEAEYHKLQGLYQTDMQAYKTAIRGYVQKENTRNYER